MIFICFGLFMLGNGLQYEKLGILIHQTFNLLQLLFNVVMFIFTTFCPIFYIVCYPT